MNRRYQAMTESATERTAAGALGADALDFWLGDWQLEWDPDGHGTNAIQRILDERVVEETFVGHDADGTLRGRSVSVLDPADGRWHQTWVDSTGTYLEFAAVEVDGRIAFRRETTREGRPISQRMVWLDVQADRLRWEWQRSVDGGETWDLVWAIRYRRA